MMELPIFMVKPCCPLSNSKMKKKIANMETHTSVHILASNRVRLNTSFWPLVSLHEIERSFKTLTKFGSITFSFERKIEKKLQSFVLLKG